MAAKPIWQKYSDNVAKDATITISLGTPPTDLTNYGPEILVDDNPAKFAKIESTTGAWLFAYPAKQIIQVASLIHHDFDAGADVVLQGNATDSWGAPTFEAAFTIPAWLGGTGPRSWPVNPWLDLTTMPGYDPTGFKYWRLLITANSQNIQMGQIWLGNPLRRLDPALGWDFQKVNAKRYIENSTAYGVITMYSRGTNQWAVDIPHRMNNALEAEMIEQWFDADGRAYPWLFVPDASVNAAYFVRWSTAVKNHRFLDRGVIDNRFAVEEVARGLRPGV
jgi:hypothetical protein